MPLFIGALVGGLLTAMALVMMRRDYSKVGKYTAMEYREFAREHGEYPNSVEELIQSGAVHDTNLEMIRANVEAVRV